MTAESANVTPLRRLVDAARSTRTEYAQGEDRPLGGYLGAMGVYGATYAGVAAVARARGHRLPERLSWSDIALLTVATHKLSRMIAKDTITSPIRAPFTRYEGVSGPAELSEEVRGTGVRHAVGELLTCPFCLAVWTATGFTAGFVVAPRATRLAATVLTAVTGADTLQLVYAKAEQSAD